MFRQIRSARQTTATRQLFDDAAQRSAIELDSSQLRAVAALISTDDVYLSGPAGRGKTWLLDVLATTDPTVSTLRLHWHEFIRNLHLLIRDNGGIDCAIAHLLDSRRVVCFDELDVQDPADGIFIDRLLTVAARSDVRVVVTSNRRPEQQMPNPLFHDSFLPTIRMLQERFTVIDLDGGLDYRTVSGHESGFSAGRWSTDDGILSQDSPATVSVSVSVSVSGRSFAARQSGSASLWVDFDQICATPLGATDYLALTERYHHWTIAAIPDLGSTGMEPAMRFVHLVDVLYERDITTSFMADVPLTRFGQNGIVPPGTPRLLSRLGQLDSERRDEIQGTRT